MNAHTGPVTGQGSVFIDDPLVVFRRAALWTFLCATSALPSFLWAHQEYSRSAMLVGVVAFILLYTVTTSTQTFHRFSRRAFVRRTLYIGYTIRFVLSALFPLGMALDLLPGLLSIEIVESHLGKSHGFVHTLLITLLQGTFLNIILGVFMVLVYAVQFAMCAPPQLDTGKCERCGYDLRASYEFGRCPECGMPCTQPATLPDSAAP